MNRGDQCQCDAASEYELMELFAEQQVQFDRVIVSGLPALIWDTNSGITDPRDTMTLP